MGNRLNTFFQSYLERGSVFANKRVLQSTYVPDDIEHRDEQIDTIANILAPALRGERPSNLFIYGKTGTGKTLTVKYTAENMIEVANKQQIPLKVFYLNCKLKKIADTEYRLIAELSRQLGKAVPPTGLPTDEVYNAFYSAIDTRRQIIIFILDEVDQLVKKAGDEIIYNLTRINAELKQAEVGLVGISNDLTFSNHLDPRVKSSLSEEEVVFPPYNALQIQSILKKRCALAFKPGALADGVIAKCAAYAAREHGDARRALELIRVAGEISERDGKDAVEIPHIDEAEEKIERDRFVDVVRHQPKQFQAVLQTILSFNKQASSTFFTGDVYDDYKRLCTHAGLRPLTQRRVSDIIAELDMLGLITAKVISKGRFGRTREISVSIPSSVEPRITSILKEDLGL